MIAIIDIETTDFFKKGGKIVEVGIVGLDPDTGKVYKLFNSVCREEGLTGKDHDAWIFKNSTLAIEDVREAPLFGQIAPDIQKALDKCTGATAFNKVFDLEFLRDRGIKVENELECPMICATDVLKIPQRNKWAKDPYKWPSVQECWNFFFPKNPYVEEHRGLDDATHEALIVMKLIKIGKFKI